MNHANFAETTLAAAITTTDSTEITVASEAGFPAVDFIISIDTEAMLVTNVATTTWTVTRGYEGSTAAIHLNGAMVYHDISAAEADSIATKAPLAPASATYTPATGAQTVALDVSSVNMHVVTGHAGGTAITFTVTGATNAQPFVVSILQGGTTVSTITAWFATVRWAGGTAPTLTATLNKRDTFGFIRTGADTYDGFVIGQEA